MAQRYGHRRIEVAVGIGGTADMNGRVVASANSVEFDPKRTLGSAGFQSAGPQLVGGKSYLASSRNA